MICIGDGKLRFDNVQVLGRKSMLLMREDGTSEQEERQLPITNWNQGKNRSTTVSNVTHWCFFRSFAETRVD